MAEKSPDKTYNLEEFISSGSDDLITYSNFSLLQSISGIQIPSENLIFDYMSELKQASVLVILSEAELQKYKYKPKLLAFDIYGSTECYFIIMALNNIIDVRDFTLKRLRMIEPSIMDELMGYIYEANINLINENRETL